MEIKEKCPNCHKPNLIDRQSREDIFCGWCGSEFIVMDDGLVPTLIKNNHMTARQKERARKAEQSKSGVLSG